MATRDGFARRDAERLLTWVGADARGDSFIDRTLDVCEHGGRLTTIGRLVLGQRLRRYRRLPRKRA